MFKKTYLFFMLAFLMQVAGFAQELIVFSTNTYDSSLSDIPYGVVADSDENIIVTGEINKDYFTVKYNKNLLYIDSVVYDGGADDIAHAVAVDGFDNIIVTGESQSSDKDFVTIKYNNLFSLISSATYSGGAGDDMAYGIAVDSQDNIIVTGKSYDGATFNYCTVKYNGNLQVVASAGYDSGGDDTAFAVAVDADDNIIVTGKSKPGAIEKFYTIKYDRMLKEIRSAAVSNGYDDRAYAVAVDTNSNVFVAGLTLDGATRNFFAVKYSDNLNVIDTLVYDSGNDEWASGISVDFQGNVIIAGRTKKDGFWNFATRKYTNNFSFIASAEFNSDRNDAVNCVAADKSGNAVVAGESEMSVLGDKDYFLIKYNGSPNVSAVGNAYQGETTEVIIEGSNFYEGASVIFLQHDIDVQSVSVKSSKLISAMVAVPMTVPLGNKDVIVANVSGESGRLYEGCELVRTVTVSPSEQTLACAFFETGEVSVLVPAAAVESQVQLVFSAVADMPSSEEMHLLNVPVRIQFNPEVDLLKECMVSIPYREQDVEGYVNNSLGAVLYNASSRRWETMSSNHDILSRLVICDTNKLGIFSLAAQGCALKGLKVYPNPYKPSSAGDFGDTEYGEGIIFFDVTRHFRIKVFNIAGELVFEKEIQNNSNIFLWDARNNDGDKAASGIYIYYIEDLASTSNTARGKLAIIR